MNRLHARQQELQNRQAAPTGGGTAYQLTGPRSAALDDLSRALDKAPATRRLAAMQPVQRIIKSMPSAGGGQTFGVKGRAGPHNTAGNRQALAALRLDRHNSPSDAAQHANNELETHVVTHRANDTAGSGLHMAHHVSDAVIQNAIAAAANAYNLAPAASAAAWAHVQALMAGIQPPPATAAVPAFQTEATNAYNNALHALAALTAVHPIPHTPAMDVHLTALANAIANSPMNLHHGDGRTNMSLGHHGDPNNYPRPGLNRRLTWRSQQMRDALAHAGLNPGAHDRTHADALAMQGTLAQQHALQMPGMPPGSIHNSANGFF